MADSLAVVEASTIRVEYPVTPSSIASELSRYRGHSFATPALYKQGMECIAHCVKLRGSIETHRKLLKEDSVRYGRAVDARAKELEALVMVVESDLRGNREAVDAARRREKEAKAAAERKAIEDKIRAERDEAERAERARREAEHASKAAELAERSRAMEAERAKMRADIEAAAREAKAAVLEQRRASDALAAMAEELAALKAAKEAAERKERAKFEHERMIAEAEETKLRELEFKAEAKKRLDAIAPDKSKLTAYSTRIKALFDQAPQVSDPTADAVLTKACNLLGEAVDALNEWCAL